jgi:uncharacterized membrane protein YgcG
MTLRLVVLALAFLPAAMPAQDFPPFSGEVVDQADLVAPDQEDALGVIQRVTQAAAIIDHRMMPRFRNGRLAAGILSGTPGIPRALVSRKA